MIYASYPLSVNYVKMFHPDMVVDLPRRKLSTTARSSDTKYLPHPPLPSQMLIFSQKPLLKYLNSCISFSLVLNSCLLFSLSESFDHIGTGTEKVVEY